MNEELEFSARHIKSNVESVRASGMNGRMWGIRGLRGQRACGHVHVHIHIHVHVQTPGRHRGHHHLRGHHHREALKLSGGKWMKPPFVGRKSAVRAH